MRLPSRLLRRYVISVTFSRDDKRILSASKDNSIILWDVETESKILKFRHEKGSKLTDASFSPDGRKVASTAEDGQLHIWDTDVDFAIWLGVQAFLALLRGQGRNREMYLGALARFRDDNPLAFGRHSSISPRSLLAYITEHTAAREDVSTAIRGLLLGYRQPINLYPEDGPTVLDRAIAHRSRTCTEMLVQNLRYHPISPSRNAWTRALPVLTEIFPDLVLPLVKDALIATPTQSCRTAELSSDQFVVVGSSSSAPPSEFALMESHKVRQQKHHDVTATNAPVASISEHTVCPLRPWVLTSIVYVCMYVYVYCVYFSLPSWPRAKGHPRQILRRWASTTQRA